MTLACLRVLTSTLIPTAQIIRAPNLHEIPGLSLPVDQSILQHQLADMADFTFKNKMKINHKKTEIILFNFSKKYNFLPQLAVSKLKPDQNSIVLVKAE